MRTQTRHRLTGYCGQRALHVGLPGSWRPRATSDLAASPVLSTGSQQRRDTRDLRDVDAHVLEAWTLEG